MIPSVTCSSSSVKQVIVEKPMPSALQKYFVKEVVYHLKKTPFTLLQYSELQQLFLVGRQYMQQQN
eukprot:15333971-Ditylum_brightwellii.AAC.1